MSNRTQTARAEDPRTKRHTATKTRILREAWKLAERDGVAGVSLGDLAKRVGLRQPSLYTYFVSKNDLYDELFAAGNRQLLAEVVHATYSDEPREALKEFVAACVRFSSLEPARHSLLFQRPIPDFEPSPESYALAEEFYDFFRSLIRRAGVTRQEDLDVFAALCQGLSEQQVSNEPGGDRWVRLAGSVVDMYLDRVEKGGFGPEVDPQ